MKHRSVGADASPTSHEATSVPTDGTLVARVLAGDDAAFGLLFRRHATAVHTFAQRRTRSTDLADDVTAAAFEKAWRALDSLGDRHGDKFRPWIFRIAANEMASLMRSQTRRHRREQLATSRGEVPADGRVMPQEGEEFAAIDGAIDRDVMLAALSDLSERYQEVISLRYLSDLTAAETAAALGISRGNVAVLLHRALGALRTNMEGRS